MTETLRILLVEDDEDDYILAREMLGDAFGRSIDLEWVATYEAALPAIGRAAHDAYLVDYRLGERNGLEIVQQAVALGCRAPIILLTGQDSHDIDLEAIRAGAADYLVKGEISGPLLKRTIRYAIERKRAEDELRKARDELELRVQERTWHLEQEITERRYAEKALHQAKEQAEAANRAKSDFLSSMSHELRTPMNAILGFAQLLDTNPKERLTPSQTEYIHHVLDGADHLLGLIDEILDLSKIDSGRACLALEAVSSHTVIEECLTLSQTLAHDRSIELVDRSVDAVLRPIVADHTRVRQVLINLLSNGIKYNRDEGKVFVDAEETTDGMMRITVTDTGLGIPEEKQDQLFEPFTRLGAEATDVDGTGIGLTISKRLVELMNGRIGFHSEVGRGSAFWVELPLADADQEEAGDAKTASQGTDSESVSPQPHRILYVEDNLANVHLMREIVGRISTVSMLSAHTAELGLVLAQEHEPDLILMDINLPDGDGFAALERLRSSPRTRDIPVIALSAAAMPDDIERGRRSGFKTYLTKPVNVEEVCAAIADALECT